MRNLIIFSLILTLLFVFNACTSECDNCGADGASNEVGDLDLCDSCYKDAKALMSFDN